MNLIAPKTTILPPAQRALWPALCEIEHGFVLYGGTAIALRYGHRQSIDFDFFGVQSFDPDLFKAKYDFLKSSETIQLAPNTLSVLARTARGEVKVSFFGGLGFGRAGNPDICQDNLVRLASPLDLAVQKLKVIRVRSEAKDFLDLDCLLRNGVHLAEALGAAQVLYPGFPIPVTLRAMCYFDDGDLGTLPSMVKKRLMAQASQFKAVVESSRVNAQVDLSLKEIEKAAQMLPSQAGKRPRGKNRPTEE